MLHPSNQEPGSPMVSVWHWTTKAPVQGLRKPGGAWEAPCYTLTVVTGQVQGVCTQWQKDSARLSLPVLKSCAEILKKSKNDGRVPMSMAHLA